MGDAKRDQNLVPTLLAVSNADGTTPVLLYADPVTHRLLVSSVVSGAGLAIVLQTDTFVTTAGQTVFTLSQDALFILLVAASGQVQTPTADYTFNGTDTVTLTLPGGLPADQNVLVTYVHA